MNAQSAANRLDRRDEMVLAIFAVLVPLFTIPALLGV